MDTEQIEVTLDEAWTALEDDNLDAALAAIAKLVSAAEVEPYLGEVILLEVQVRLRAGDRAGAAAALERQPAPAPDDDNLLLARAELALAEWRIGEARELYTRLVASVPPEESAPHHERLALCCDLTGDFALADEHLLRSRGVPPDHFTEAAFEAEVVAAAEDLPPAFRGLFERYAVVLDPVPDATLAIGGGRDPLETPPDLFGLFLGATELDSLYSGEHPPHIRLFQRNLERATDSIEHLREEIRITLYHELGHALGLDEDGVDAIGLA
ncbi:MAG: metallopeptidase family protein [Planctomycetota bacterium]|nr:metallopeptidase family protein [Planctomycetota bacterium]